MLVAPIVCFTVGACAGFEAAYAQTDQNSAPTADGSNSAPPPNIPHDYPGPPLRGGNGGG